ncbi:hypothetical protein CANARDRAFT_23862 [[Candida] arabinofermentans NRRL YB-2248]|uniref:Uncharacterized protein n=1 Tax=[Candida] arabinofermentans NRRL YB-2248 TaxID=983967 RepID=A0A1E4SY76_9ASCO|nr:hypothetical protein CANARDRAFT_23862 [[Candida] arabinofermentans NRRL YB-2248]
MFANTTLKPILRSTRNNISTRFVRLQSSSSNPGAATSQTNTKKKLELIEQQMQAQLQQQKQHQVQAQQKNTTSTKQKAKKGFNSLAKVPTTMKLKPKDVLLDNFFQGYKPLTLPLQPPIKKPSTVYYLEFDDNLELVNDGFTDLPSSQHSSRADDILIKDKNSTRFEFSNYSFNKDLEVQSDYDELPKNAKKTAGAATSSKKTESKFQMREVKPARTGRTRLNHIKNKKGNN